MAFFPTIDQDATCETLPFGGAMLFHVVADYFSTMFPALRLLAWSVWKRLEPGSNAYREASQYVDLMLECCLCVVGHIVKRLPASQ
jgi:hypothetical protein